MAEKQKPGWRCFDIIRAIALNQRSRLCGDVRHPDFISLKQRKKTKKRPGKKPGQKP
ncbi:hypothetical protein [Pseudomonas asturiensis]|uniref:hypothetical protein n=1 Tax=Pseudomonas asturiensis TaxID=1190415 RepID=UPI0013D029FC|nr:hypothetical protein [Pseudomonas asturiensis]